MAQIVGVLLRHLLKRKRAFLPGADFRDFARIAVQMMVKKRRSLGCQSLEEERGCSFQFVAVGRTFRPDGEVKV